MFPALFLSHGAPTLPLVDAPASTFLRNLGQQIGRPSAIIVASAHWETAVPTVSTITSNTTIHDFYGFPRRCTRFTINRPVRLHLLDRRRTCWRRLDWRAKSIRREVWTTARGCRSR